METNKRFNGHKSRITKFENECPKAYGRITELNERELEALLRLKDVSSSSRFSSECQLTASISGPIYFGPAEPIGGTLYFDGGTGM